MLPTVDAFLPTYHDHIHQKCGEKPGYQRQKLIYLFPPQLSLFLCHPTSCFETECHHLGK